MKFPSALASGPVFNPVDYGAKPDGRTLCHQAIQKAIDVCSQSRGGGVVRLKEGRFLSGTIRLRSNVTLEIAADATLVGSPSLADYPAIRSPLRSYTDTDNYADKTLVYAENATNITLRGKGTIDGQGGQFGLEAPARSRPFLLRFIQCTNVTVEDVNLRNPAFWTQHYLACDHLTIRRINVWAHCNKNNDGIDIDGCHNVHIERVLIDSDDDGIVLKSTLERACENVTITDCTVSSHADAIKCGTETSGGFKNLSISRCVIKPSKAEKVIHLYREGLSGISLQIVDGGTMDGVKVSEVRIQGTRAPLFLRLGDRARPFRKDMPRPGIGSLRNVVFSDIIATEAGSMESPIAGIAGHPIENLTLKNIHISTAGGGNKEDVLRRFEEKRGSYPRSDMFAERLPASGLYFWYVKNLSLENVRLSTAGADERPQIVFENASAVTNDGKPVDGRSNHSRDAIRFLPG